MNRQEKILFYTAELKKAKKEVSYLRRKLYLLFWQDQKNVSLKYLFKQSQQHKKYYKKNRQAIIKKVRTWQRANKKQVSKNSLKYYYKNKFPLPPPIYTKSKLSRRDSMIQCPTPNRAAG